MINTASNHWKRRILDAQGNSRGRRSFYELRRALYAEFLPQTTTVGHAVDELALNIWRWHQFTAWETAAIRDAEGDGDADLETFDRLHAYRTACERRVLAITKQLRKCSEMQRNAVECGTGNGGDHPNTCPAGGRFDLQAQEPTGV